MLDKYTTFFIIIFIISFISCNKHNSDGIQIGFQTTIKATNNNILSTSNIDTNFFKEYLRIENSHHYPGKTFSLFDTVYTSTVLGSTPESVVEKLKRQGEYNFTILNLQTKDGLYELFLRREDQFLYRVIVAEKINQQSILVDVLKPDSLIISNYFKEQKIIHLITK
jgi:hypothetical protein